MKPQLLYRLLIIPAVLLAGCELDNYAPPSSPLNGRLVHDGQPIEIRQGMNVLQLFQASYENNTPIPIQVRQNGAFSSMLFDGSYQLVRIAGNGPWRHVPDTMVIDMRGATSIDVPVTPFFPLLMRSFP